MTKLIRRKGVANNPNYTSTIRGRLGSDTGRFGLFHFGAYEYGAQNEIGLDHHGVYQMRHCIEGKIPVKMRFPKTIPETSTPAREAVWAKYRAAILGWQSLTDEQKAVYNERVKGTRLNGCNLFVKEYMLS